MNELCSIYQSEEERLNNKPRKETVPNSALEKDMNRYKAKIEGRFQLSEMNRKYVFPLLPESEDESSWGARSPVNQPKSVLDSKCSEFKKPGLMQ